MNTDEARNIFLDTASDTWGNDDDEEAEYVYSDRCGWLGRTFEGYTRKYFRFSDSTITGSFKDSASRAQRQIVLNDFETAEFAGIVCLRDETLVQDSEYGRELFSSDGTEPGTLRIHDLYKGKVSSNPTSLVSISNYLYFSARHVDVGRELFRLDLDTDRVELVEDIRKGYV